jgi:hypothetical protein
MRPLYIKKTYQVRRQIRKSIPNLPGAAQPSAGVGDGRTMELDVSSAARAGGPAPWTPIPSSAARALEREAEAELLTGLHPFLFSSLAGLPPSQAMAPPP